MGVFLDRVDQLVKVHERMTKDHTSISVRCRRCKRPFRRPLSQMHRNYCRACEDKPYVVGIVGDDD